MKQIPTGINGLDEMLNGGFPEGRVILVCGGPGTGKTIFSLQYLIAAAKRGEAGFYITLEEPLRFIKQNITSFRWDLDRFEKEGLLRTLDINILSYKNEWERQANKYSVTKEVSTYLINEVYDAIDKIGAKHIVIDPLTSVTVHQHQAGKKRKEISRLFASLRKIGCTSILTTELTPKSNEFLMEEFLADGVLKLDKVIQNFKLIHTIRIEKMRGIKFDEQPRIYDILDEGIKVYSSEPVKIL